MNSSDTDGPDWIVLADGAATTTQRPLRRRRVFLQVILGALVVIVAVGIAGVVAARRLAEAEAVADAAKTTDLLGRAADSAGSARTGILTGDPAAVAALDEVVRDHVLAGPTVVRVKVWDPSGRIVYSDEPRLIGASFAVESRTSEAVFSDPQIRAEVSDLDAPENVYEARQRSAPGDLPAGLDAVREPVAVRGVLPLRRGDRPQRAAVPRLRGHHPEQHRCSSSCCCCRCCGDCWTG